MLLEQLGYVVEQHVITWKFSVILQNPYTAAYVYEADGIVTGFATIEFMLQLATPGDIARIGYLSVHPDFQGKGTGTVLKRFCMDEAYRRNCDIVEIWHPEKKAYAVQPLAPEGYKNNLYGKTIHPGSRVEPRSANIKVIG